MCYSDRRIWRQHSSRSGVYGWPSYSYFVVSGAFWPPVLNKCRGSTEDVRVLVYWDVVTSCWSISCRNVGNHSYSDARHTSVDRNPQVHRCETVKTRETVLHAFLYLGPIQTLSDSTDPLPLISEVATSWGAARSKIKFRIIRKKKHKITSITLLCQRNNLLKMLWFCWQ